MFRTRQPSFTRLLLEANDDRMLLHRNQDIIKLSQSQHELVLIVLDVRTESVLDVVVHDVIHLLLRQPEVLG